MPADDQLLEGRKFTHRGEISGKGVVAIASEKNRRLQAPDDLTSSGKKLLVGGRINPSAVGVNNAR